jgi:hypothetical protein
MEISGKLKLILAEETFASGFNKRSFVIAVEDRYPYDVCFDLLKEKVAMIDNFQIGENLKVSFDVKSREYNGKWFTGCTAWKIDRAGGSVDSGSNGSGYQQAGPPPISAGDIDRMSGPADEDKDDLPF